jgi:hypothetical protein
MSSTATSSRRQREVDPGTLTGVLTGVLEQFPQRVGERVGGFDGRALVGSGERTLGILLVRACRERVEHRFEVVAADLDLFERLLDAPRGFGGAEQVRQSLFGHLDRLRV